MRKFKFLLLLCCMVVVTTHTQAATLAWESWGQVSGTIDGYAGTSGVSETGLTGVWSAAGPAWTVTRSATASDWTPRGVTGGAVVDEIADNMHWLETNAWNVSSGARPLATSIDLTTAGTYYMSFFSQAGGYDTVLQIGLANATNELIWGNGWNRGLTAYYGGIGTGPDTNNNGTNMDGGTYGSWDTAFWVAEIASDGTDVTVTIDQYNLDSTGGALSSPTTRSVVLTGAADVFDSLAFKLDGEGGQYPGMDEFRIGDSFASVTGTEFVANKPVNGESLASINSDLIFTLDAPNIVIADVFFEANDPNADALLVNDLAIGDVGHGPVQKTVDPGVLAYETTYYWKVIGYEPNELEDPVINNIPVVGPVWSFTTKALDIPPVVDANDSIITTLVLAASPIELGGSVIDDGTSPLTNVGWKAYEVVAGGGETTKVTFADATDPATTVTISEASTYVLVLSATDALGTVTDAKQIVVYADDCEAAKATGTWEANYYDRDDDCDVDLLDFEVFAVDWLGSTALDASYLYAQDVSGGENALLAEYWFDINSADVNDLLADADYPANPDGTYLVVDELRGVAPQGDHYGQRITGYIVPPTSGDYIFYIASDDASRLFLSADDTPVDTDPALGNQIAEVRADNWTETDQWDKFAEQTSAPVTLTAGQRYYVEILHVENIGGDNVSVGWSTDGGTTIEVIPGSGLRWY